VDPVDHTTRVAESARDTENAGVTENTENTEDNAWKADCMMRMGYIRALGIPHVQSLVFIEYIYSSRLHHSHTGASDLTDALLQTLPNRTNTSRQLGHEGKTPYPGRRLTSGD